MYPCKIAELAQPSQPAYIRAQALTTIVRELSPRNPRHQDGLRALESQPRPNPTLPELALTPEQQKEFHLHPVAADLAASAHGEELPPDDDDSAEAEDDPW